MTIRRIMVPVSGRPEDAAALEMAARIAKLFGAHLDIIHSRRDPQDAIPFLGEGTSALLVEQIMTAAERDGTESAARAHRLFEEWRQRHDLAVAAEPAASASASATTAWREFTAREEDTVIAQGRLTDLILLARPTATAPTRPLFETALLDSGRPVLMVPPADHRISDAFATIAVAWNGSAEAARAVTASLPFLRKAKRVVILAIEEGSLETIAASAAELRAYLRWHGIDAVAITLDTKGAGVGAGLLDEAGRLGADLLVMGAYTHSRMRQMIFGGVTSHVMSHAALPLLMAH